MELLSAGDRLLSAVRLIKDFPTTNNLDHLQKMADAYEVARAARARA